MIAAWVCDELQTADFNDRRLTERAMEMTNAFAKHSTASIPAACGGHSEMVAAYRFCDNDEVTLDRVLAPHVEKTLERMQEHSVVLLVQDTTELDLSRPQQQVVGAGPMDGSSRRGLFLHLMEAFAVDGTPLGAVWQYNWVREEDDKSQTAEEKRKARKAAPIEEKESFRWVQGLREARAAAEKSAGVQCIAISDSEADIYELLADSAGQTQALDWIVRACQDRALTGDSGEHLTAELMKQPALFSYDIKIRKRDQKVSCEARTRRQDRKAREAVVEVRVIQVTLRPPPRPDRKLPEVTVNAVLVREINPPADEDPVEWLLLTTLPIGDAEQVRLVIQYYGSRWMIEVFFKTLKSGCRVEQRRFEHLDRFKRCLGIYLIVTWRTLYVCRLGRECPDLSCEIVFEPSEWKSAYMVTTGKKPPRKIPRLQEMIRLIATLGGYIDKPRDEPGPQTVWLGIQRMYDLALGWDTFGPGS